VKPEGEMLIVSILPNGAKGLIALGHPDIEVVFDSGCAELQCMSRVARQLFKSFSDELHVSVQDRGLTFIGNGVPVCLWQLPEGQFVKVCGQDDECGVGVRLPVPLPSLVMAVAAIA